MSEPADVDRSRDDSDEGWGEPGRDDRDRDEVERLLRERPPHWD